MIANLNPRIHNLSPLVLTIDDFANAEECAAIIALVEGRLKPAAIAGDGGKVVQTDLRTNSDILVRPEKAPVLGQLLMKLGLLMRLPTDHAEAFNVLHYLPGQEFKPHADALSAEFIARHGEAHAKMGGQRLFSTMIYLNDVEEGGATTFPHLGLSVAARLGRLLVFSNTEPGSDQPDPLSEHAGEPVIRGEKWSAIAWWRQGPYTPVALTPEAAR